MKKTLIIAFVIGSFFAIGCSNDSHSIDNTPKDAELQKMIVENLDFLGVNASMVVTPKKNNETQKVLFAPFGKEESMLKGLGFKIDLKTVSTEKCGLKKLAAAKEVGRITDRGGCAQVRKDPTNSSRYCVKEINCQQ